MMQMFNQGFRNPVPFNRFALSWLQAFDECVRDGRDYTELHFYRHPETGEIIITYWEIN
jgi:hypothetical protein